MNVIIVKERSSFAPQGEREAFPLSIYQKLFDIKEWLKYLANASHKIVFCNRIQIYNFLCNEKIKGK